MVSQTKYDRKILLCGGIKNTQDEDIEKAKEYWRDYERSQNPN
jgi:putative component of toxin-antitoxin plasmid stabilization module